MIQTIDISLIPSDNKPVINVSQFDNISRVLRFNVFDDAEMETPHVFDDGDTVLLNIRKNDNNIVVITGVIVSDIDPDTQEITEQYLTFELTEQACACVGSNFGEVSITRGRDEVIGSCNFKLIVERSPLAGGVSSQTAIDNLTTQIEQITEEVIGENYYDKQAIDGMIEDVESEIPTKTSQLTNDSGFITASDIPTIPTKTSQLTNDSGFITASDIPTIPTKTSQLTNDSGYITASDIPTIPTKTSQLTNDSGFTTIDDAATANDKTWSSDKISDELYALLPVGSVSGAIANFNTALSWPLDIEAEFDANVDGISAVNVTQEGKNLMHIGSDVISKTENGIDFTVNRNDDLEVISIVLNNTATARTYFLLGRFDIKAGTILSGCPSGGSNNSYQLAIDGTVYYDRGSGVTINEDLPNAKLMIVVANGYTANNLTFKPMLRGLNSNSDFEPYDASKKQTIFINLGNIYYNGGKVTIDKNGHRTLTADGQTVALPDGEPVNALVGDNNVYCDTGDTSVRYNDTIQNYIDTRVQTVQASSNRTLSLMRSSETLETIEPIERGDNNDDNAR